MCRLQNSGPFVSISMCLNMSDQHKNDKKKSVVKVTFRNLFNFVASTVPVVGSLALLGARTSICIVLTKVASHMCGVGSTNQMAA